MRIQPGDRISYRLDDSTRPSTGRVTEVGYDGRIGVIRDSNGFLDLLWDNDKLHILPEEAPAMTAPTTTTTKIVATVVREGMRVRLANRKDTALSADYITVGRVDTEGLMRKVIREDGTTYATVGVRAKFELEPEQTEKPARAARTPRAAQAGPKLSKHAKAHLVKLSLVEGQSTTRQEWGADPMIVKSLAGKGLITVTADPAEKQRKTDLIELTEAGRAYVNADDAKYATPTQTPASE